MEEAVELIAVVAVVVGALLVLIVIAMGALVVDGLLQRTVERCQGSVQPHSQGLRECAAAGRTGTPEWA